MARICRNESFIVQPRLFIIIAFALLILPAWWVIGWFTAVFFHELCHYVALRLCKVPVYRIAIGAFGAEIQTGEMTACQEIICALAGPLGSLVLLFLLQVFPYVSLCALGQSLYNLVPIYPMDGGRAVKGICIGLMGERRGLQFSKVVSLFFLIMLTCVCLWASLRYKLGILPIVTASLFVIRILKIPCKERQLIVQ